MRRDTEALLRLRADDAEDEAIREAADAQNAEDREDFVSAARAYERATEWRERAALIRATIERGTALSMMEDEDEAPRSSWLVEPPE